MSCDLEIITVEISKPKSKPFLVSCWYRPPDSPVEFFNNYEELIKNARCATRIHSKVSETFSDRKFIKTRAFDCQSAVFDCQYHFIDCQISTASITLPVEDCRLAVESSCFNKFTIRERFRNFTRNSLRKWTLKKNKRNISWRFQL
jgi:hypothetical protein